MDQKLSEPISGWEEQLWRSGYAVGLSAVSFSAALQKDAASIPNAGGASESDGAPYIN